MWSHLCFGELLKGAWTVKKSPCPGDKEKAQGTVQWEEEHAVLGFSKVPFFWIKYFTNARWHVSQVLSAPQQLFVQLYGK